MTLGASVRKYGDEVEAGYVRDADSDHHAGPVGSTPERMMKLWDDDFLSPLCFKRAPGFYPFLKCVWSTMVKSGHGCH